MELNPPSEAEIQSWWAEWRHQYQGMTMCTYILHIRRERGDLPEDSYLGHAALLRDYPAGWPGSANDPAAEADRQRVLGLGQSRHRYATEGTPPGNRPAEEWTAHTAHHTYDVVRPEQETAIPAATQGGAARERAQQQDPPRTMLAGGHLSIMIDLGSCINLMGINTKARWDAILQQYGLSSTTTARPLLRVNGVGAGFAPCTKQGTFPIAPRYNNSAHLDEYSANLAEGCGANLPALWGLVSLENKRAIITLEKVSRTSYYRETKLTD